MAQAPSGRAFFSETGNVPGELRQDTSDFNVIFVHSRLDDYGLPPSVFRVYCHLARRASSGAAWPSVANIARICQLHPQTVRMALRILVQHRLITRMPRHGRTPIYRITPAAQWQPPTNINGDPCESDAPPLVSASTPPKQIKDHPSEKDAVEGNPVEGYPKKENPHSPPMGDSMKDTESTSSQVEEIYAAYPKKVGKPAALRAIRRALDKCAFDFLLERTRLFAQTCNSPPEFIPFPSTWFGQERFNDDPSTWRRADPNREHEYYTTLYDYAEGQYRIEVFDLKFPEDPTDADKSSDDAWLHYFDRLAVKYGNRRPDYLFLLRRRGALNHAEMQSLRRENPKLYSKYRSVNAQLREALLEANLEMAAELIHAGADINARNRHGSPLLHEIIGGLDDAERLPVVRFMLEHGADPRLIDEESSDPLFSAVLAMDTEVLRLLLDHGADPNRPLDAGEALYDYAEGDYRYEIYDLHLPEEPTDADKVSEETWLHYLDRLAIKYGERRPDHLFLLRERGALTTTALRRLQTEKRS
jgi:hypothetical protein